MTSPEIHAFVIWSKARSAAGRILDDIARTFIIRDVFEVAWSPERFADNLTRFYLQQLPAGSDKQKHCGTGPFLVVVVEDAEPSYRTQRTGKGLREVNANMSDAKERYRAWTGGGHRVHASVSAREGDHDLLLLLGRRAHDYRQLPPWDGITVRYSRDLLGFNGWNSVGQLLDAVELTMTYALLTPGSPEVDGPLDLLVEDSWWAGVLLDQNPSAHEIELRRQELVVDARPLTIRLHSGAEDIDRTWYLEIISHRARTSIGALVARPTDWFYCVLHQAVSGRALLEDQTVAQLHEVALAHSLPNGDFRDLGFASLVLHDFLRASGYHYVAT